MKNFLSGFASLIAFAGVFLSASTDLNADDAAVSPGDVSGVEIVPVDGDIFRYKAVLVDTDGGSDLYVFKDAGDGWVKAAYAPDIAWRGGAYGQSPWLEASGNGSLKVYSENSAIGRSRWEQVLTIAYRNSIFVVAGYTLSYYDTLDEAMSGTCDVNLLTGKGIHKDKPFRASLKALPVQNWTMDTQPQECSAS
ncbi:hypothetical protein ABVF61_01060 [Roseibium sp. HPY-6]|uniref:hypothetical protein n=1 Tax=Roseibium sp. HPY-6 TaxID=3229852 RepID=UPI00338FDEEA